MVISVFAGWLLWLDGGEQWRTASALYKMTVVDHRQHSENCGFPSVNCYYRYPPFTTVKILPRHHQTLMVILNHGRSESPLSPALVKPCDDCLMLNKY
jgi:hypothetical protein